MEFASCTGQKKNWSPQQIMINSLIKDADLVLSNDKISEYEIDYDGPVAEEEFGSECSSHSMPTIYKSRSFLSVR